MTATSEETTILEHLDFQPPCQVTQVHGDGSPPPAVLLAVSKAPLPCCGNLPDPAEVYMCQDCWDLLAAPNVLVVCGFCGSVVTFTSHVARVIRL